MLYKPIEPQLFGQYAALGKTVIHLNELDHLNLPKTEYVIFGSGPIAIRGLRENHDIDILVTEKLWNILSEKYPITKKEARPDSIYIGSLQFWK